MAYVCFIVDVFSRMIVGWRVASNMRTDMVLDAIEMARWSRGNDVSPGWSCHSDAGVAVHVDSLRRTTRRDRRACPRSGPSATATTTPSPRRSTGYYKAELIYGPDRPGPGRPSTTSSSPPSAGCTGTTHERLHGYLGDVPPAEFEAAFYAAQQTDHALVGNPIARRGAAATGGRATAPGSRPSPPARARGGGGEPDPVGAGPERGEPERREHRVARPPRRSVAISRRIPKMVSRIAAHQIRPRATGTDGQVAGELEAERAGLASAHQPYFWGFDKAERDEEHARGAPASEHPSGSKRRSSPRAPGLVDEPPDRLSAARWRRRPTWCVEEPHHAAWRGTRVSPHRRAAGTAAAVVGRRRSPLLSSWLGSA